MANQNLVSAALPAEAKAQILSSLSSVKEQLNFLLTLQVDDVKSLFKAGNGYHPFIDRAYHAVTDHPEIMSGAFNIDEFIKDYTLAQDLIQVYNKVNELALGLDRTLTAVLSDALSSGLDIYAAVKLNKDRVVGLEQVAQEMSVFFQKTRKPATPAPSGS